MFQVWDPNGILSPYIPGSVRTRRTIERVQGASTLHSDIAAAPKTPNPAFTTATPQAPSDSITNPYQRISQALQRRERAVTAQQIMNSPVISVGAGATFAYAFELIRSHRFRHLPVLSKDKKLVGILSDRDLLRRAASASADERKHLADLHVSEIMHTNVVSALPTVEIREIAKVMFEERIGAMPIVNEKQELEGMLTRSDILRAVVAKAPLELWI